MTEKTKEYRKKLADFFLDVLEKEGLNWKKGWFWSGGDRPMNAKSQANYKGINRFYLAMVSMERGYKDNRWATFRQVQDMGCRLKDAKGQGVTIEYWFPYDRQEKHHISWEEFLDQTGGRAGERFTLHAVYSTVFNAAVIEGLPELPTEVSGPHIPRDKLVETLSRNMHVEIRNDGGGRAYYSPREDRIHLPRSENFFSQYEYNATALHELSHATGAPHRLNRNMGGVFGSPDYAYEELVAEISSCFMSENLQTEPGAKHLENHQAYVQSWLKAIRKKPETLVKAVADAEKAAAYMEYKAELIPQKEYEKVTGSVREIPNGEAMKETLKLGDKLPPKKEVPKGPKL